MADLLSEPNGGNGDITPEDYLARLMAVPALVAEADIQNLNVLLVRRSSGTHARLVIDRGVWYRLLNHIFSLDYVSSRSDALATLDDLLSGALYAGTGRKPYVFATPTGFKGSEK